MYLPAQTPHDIFFSRLNEWLTFHSKNLGIDHFLFCPHADLRPPWNSNCNPKSQFHTSKICILYSLSWGDYHLSNPRIPIFSFLLPWHFESLFKRVYAPKMVRFEAQAMRTRQVSIAYSQVLDCSELYCITTQMNGMKKRMHWGVTLKLNRASNLSYTTKTIHSSFKKWAWSVKYKVSKNAVHYSFIFQLFWNVKVRRGDNGVE